MKKYLICMILCMGAFSGVKAQIGYQVSLLNTATGEPRANVTVNATVTITNSKNETIYTGTQKATSNDFGVLSLTVGNADTFKNVDFSKLPFFIEVSVDGQLIGKSQILNVPVAEAAKALVPTIDNISGTYEINCWLRGDNFKGYIVTLELKEGKGTCQIQMARLGGKVWQEASGVCEVEGNTIYAYMSNGSLFVMKYYNGKVYLTAPFGVEFDG